MKAALDKNLYLPVYLNERLGETRRGGAQLKAAPSIDGVTWWFNVYLIPDDQVEVALCFKVADVTYSLPLTEAQMSAILPVLEQKIESTRQPCAVEVAMEVTHV